MGHTNSSKHISGNLSRPGFLTLLFHAMNATSYTTGSIDHKENRIMNVHARIYIYIYIDHTHNLIFKAQTPKVDMHIYTVHTYRKRIKSVVGNIRAACLYTSWRAVDLVLATLNNSHSQKRKREALLYTCIATWVKMKIGSNLSTLQ